jgi:glycosyltransferase involved in cell wall biosynthesis
MRILMLTQWFDPEPDLKGLVFAKALRDRGHDVQVLTGFPNYPGGKLYPGYRVRFCQCEVMDGIPVTRVPLYPSHDKSPLGRALNYLSFAVSAAVIGAATIKRPDVVYVYHPPGTVAIPAAALRVVYRVPIVYDVCDLWPDTVRATGMVRSKVLFRIVEKISELPGRVASRLAVVSPGFRETLIRRGVAADKIELIYNWCDESHMGGLQQPNGSSAKRSPGEFNVLFAGTMGVAQALDAVLDAARICRTLVPSARFQFIGGGVDRERLERKAVDMALDNVTFLPRQPMNMMRPILAAADVLLVHLKDDPLFRITIPSKTQAYLMAGKPVLMAVLGDSAELIRNARAGLVTPPEDSGAIAAAVRQLAELTPEQRAEMGESGRRYYQANMSLKVGVDRFENIFQSLVNRARSGPQNGLVRALPQLQITDEGPSDQAFGVLSMLSSHAQRVKWTK